MTETTTPTDEIVETPVGSESTDLPTENTNESAVESVEDTASEVTAEPGSNDSTNAEEEPSKADADLKRFAKSQGYKDDELEDLTPREVKALTIARKQVQETRKKLELENKGAVEKAINEIDKESDLSDREYFEFRLKQRDMVDNIRQYWQENPDDKAYEAEAITILQAEKERYGDDAMLRLAENMPRLVREAKHNAGAFDPDKLAEKGRKEERERLNKLQSGSADGAHATTSDTPSKDEVNADWVRNVYDPTNEEHRKKLDNFMASGGKIH